ncbi:hypothetical protein MTR_4g036630 [Medicago truncatula]|uniref:Uncharacterized protein n=1 Tax=Medicago truncatula TaxID=3880 RepID=A0A072UI69_MEDTR|nr:hypothetical protein MTR_4g036630 [Medicago truncatula]
MLQVISENISPSTTWFWDEPSGHWWACNASAWWACNARGWMGDLLGSFPKSVRVRRKHVEKTCVGLWGQSTILKAVWDVTSGIKACLSQYDVVWGQTKKKLVGM